MKTIIQKKRMKYMKISVNADGSVTVSAPKHVSQAEITRFLASKKDRIEEKQKMFATRKQEITPDLSTDQILLHGEVYQRVQEHKKGPPNNRQLHDCSDIDHTTRTIITFYDLSSKTYQEQRYKTYAKAYLFGRLQEIAEFHELSYNKLYLRSAKTNRGTCSSTKNIGLNRKLVKMPRDISDYVICHELAHLLEMNHSKEFRRVVDTLYGNRKEAIQWLKKYGMSVY